MKAIATILLLVISNIFMTIAWYDHLKINNWSLFNKYGLTAVILFSWSIALFEYIFQVPANRIGFSGTGGPFSLLQLKVIQEIVTLIVFVLFSIIVFKNESIRWNHLVALIFIVFAVYFVFKK